MSEINNTDTSSKESYSEMLQEINKEISIPAKVGIISFLGGTALELSGIVVGAMDQQNTPVANDLKIVGLIGIMSGFSIIATKINSNTKRNN